MESTLPESLLTAFSQHVETRLGLHLPKGRFVDLERGVRAAAKEMGWEDVEGFARHVLEAPECQELEDLLAAHLTIGETYFYRDPRAFEVFEKEALREIVRGRAGKERELRIWSAACCTGEEPYSLAMSVRRVLGEKSGWNTRILATDLNPRFLRKARAGVYGRWSFRTLPEKMREQFFQAQPNGRWQIDGRITGDVTFAGLNFVEDTFPSAINGTEKMDVIFCRNVLMYFSRETAARVIAKLRQCLVPDGWLFTSATDAPRDLFAGFSIHEAEGTIVYRRSEDTAARKPEARTIDLSRLEPVPSLPEPIKRAVARREPDPIRPALPQVPAVPPPTCDLHQQARSLADAGRFDAALAAIDRALEADKLDAGAHYLRGVILHEQNLEAEATVSLNRALYLDPSFVLAHVTLGSLMRRGGKERAARRSYDNARQLLSRLDRDAVLPESGGITAGRLLQIISSPQQAAA